MTTIWNQEQLNIEQLNEGSKNSAVTHLGIVITGSSSNTLSASMPVDERTVQPYGILHGGVSCVLAETLGSIAANCAIKEKGMIAVGQEINANHIRPASSGKVHGTASPIHIGKSSHVWEIKIINDKDKLVCISRLTLAIIKKVTK
jgi:1,4-dihydroxy-2-naphthoyl-CoA hydrolase